MVESGFQQYLLSILQHAVGDAELLTKGSADLDWVMQFKEPSSVWYV